jgi:transposase
LVLMHEDAPQREYPLREVFNGLRYVVKNGIGWRDVPGDLPPWWAIYQQTQRWIQAGSFEAIVHDLRVVLRLAEGRAAEPSAAIFDARTVQSTPESGASAGYDGHKRKKGSKVHMAVDTLGHLLALHVTPANEQERTQVENWPLRCRRLRVHPESWCRSIRATRGRTRLRRQLSTGFSSTW